MLTAPKIRKIVFNVKLKHNIFKGLHFKNNPTLEELSSWSTPIFRLHLPCLSLFPAPIKLHQ